MNQRKGERLTYDGDGRPAKRTELTKTRFGGVWGNWFEDPTYKLFSSVTGKNITELLADGGHYRTHIHFGDANLADERNGDIYFIPTDPISGSTREIFATGEIPPSDEAESRNELGGLGTSVPVTPPGVMPPPNYENGGFAGGAETGCVDPGSGEPMPCNVAAALANHLRRVEKAFEEARNRKKAREDITLVKRLHLIANAFGKPHRWERNGKEIAVEESLESTWASRLKPEKDRSDWRTHIFPSDWIFADGKRDSNVGLRLAYDPYAPEAERSMWVVALRSNPALANVGNSLLTPNDDTGNDCVNQAIAAHNARVAAAWEKASKVNTNVTFGEGVVMATTTTGGAAIQGPWGAFGGFVAGYVGTKVGKLIDKYVPVGVAKYLDDQLVGAVRRCPSSRRR